MWIERNRLIIQAHKFLDIALTATAFIMAYFIKKYYLPVYLRGLSRSLNYEIVLLMLIITWLVTFEMFGLYNSFRQKSFNQIFKEIVKAVSTGMLVMSLFVFIFKMATMSRLMMGIFFLLDIGLLSLSKGTIYLVLKYYQQKGLNLRSILIVGSKTRAKDVISTIEKHPSAGHRVLGCLELYANDVGKKVKHGIKVIGTIDQLKKIIWEKVVDELIFAMPLKEIEHVEKYIAFAEEVGVSVRIIPDWQMHKLMYRPAIASIKFEDFLGVQTMALTTTSAKYGDLLIKSVLDYVFAIMAMILLLPFFLFIAGAIKLVSRRGPVFFQQERCGLNGRRFMIYKFRTMVADAEARRKELMVLNEADGPVFKIKKDPRIIPFIGTFLRRTSIDELPQLINVLKGEMSLVGPRPLPTHEVEKFDVWQRRRLSMKPGLTCQWQICPNRNEVIFEDWMNMDLSYIDNWSLWLDFKLLLKTAKVILMRAGR